MRKKEARFGYVRVSSEQQKEDRQILAMRREQIEESCIFEDIQSGKDFDRREYQRLMQRLQEGDVLFILSLDRLGRNYGEVQKEWRRITQDIGADIVVLDMPLLDTRRDKDLLGTFISDLVLQVLSFAAQMERDQIRARQAQGIAAAREKGLPLGRRAREMPSIFKEVCAQWGRGELSLREAAEACGIPKSTFYYHARRGQNGRRPGKKAGRPKKGRP